jgi:hypothetical protein
MLQQIAAAFGSPRCEVHPPVRARKKHPVGNFNAVSLLLTLALLILLVILVLPPSAMTVLILPISANFNR